jgi:hypothetical protein
MRRLFDRTPARQEAHFAEARALLEDGLERDFVLGLYPGEEGWLAPMLETAEAVGGAYAGEQPSYYFEASLKAKVLAAHRRKAVAAPAPRPAYGRMAAATASLMTVAGMLGVLLLGFVTADEAVPGDWNYSFKLAGERLRYNTSRGDGRIDLQLKFTQSRVQEIERKLQSGDEVSAGDLAKLEREARELAAAIRQRSLDEAQKGKLADVGTQSVAVLNNVRLNSNELDSQVSSALATVNEAVAAGTGGTAPLPPPPTPTATPVPEDQKPATPPHAEVEETATPGATAESTP